MDFTQMPVSQGYKYLLVMIDTFTGWIEGLPTRTEKADKVVKKKLLHEIIPRFGLPRSLQSDNGTSFTFKVTQGISKALKERKIVLRCVQLLRPMDCSLPFSSAYGVFQARILGCVAISFSRVSSQPRNQTQVSRIAGSFFTD